VTHHELLLTVSEAARLLRLSRAFTYELTARGDLPVVRFGRRVLIPREALERLLINDDADSEEERPHPVTP
jgi:excisionase family DNA binding protein